MERYNGKLGPIMKSHMWRRRVDDSELDLAYFGQKARRKRIEEGRPSNEDSEGRNLSKF